MKWKHNVAMAVIILAMSISAQAEGQYDDRDQNSIMESLEDPVNSNTEISNLEYNGLFYNISETGDIHITGVKEDIHYSSDGSVKFKDKCWIWIFSFIKLHCNCTFFLSN